MKIFEEKGYIYQKHVSTGGEGEVHLIKSENKDYIAKIFPKLNDNAIGLLHDIQQMNVPNIPKVYEIFNYEDKTIIIRDYIEGNTLYDEIKKNEYLSFKRSKIIISKICKTLKVLHDAKPNPIIYRDLKPENIIITPNGDVFLIDFGIARYHKREATRDTVVAGTKGYTAPEVMGGMQSDVRSDVYSVGMLFYEMLTGKNILDPPYQIRPVQESNEYLPDWLDKIIKKATDINQVNRYSSIEDFMFDLGNPKHPKSSKKKKPKVLMAVVALVLIIVGVGIWYYFSKNNEENYNMILELKFDDEADLAWINGYDNPENIFAIDEGQLHILKGGCNIDYTPKPGMIVHYKVKQPQYGAVGLSQYRINAPVLFECIYRDEERGVDHTTNSLNFSGTVFKNNGHFVDALFYITEDSSAVYAIAIDEEAQKICYTAYKIPDFMKDDVLYMEICHFSEEGSVIVESVYVAEGSLSKYLADNFESYNINKERVNEFLQKDVSALPDMVFKPADEW